MAAVLLLCVILLFVGALLTYNYLSEPEPPPPLAKPKVTAPVTAEPATTATAPSDASKAPPHPTATEPVQPASTPSAARNPIQRTQDVLAAHRDVAQAKVDATVDGSFEGTITADGRFIPPEQTSPKAATKTKQTYTEIAPGISGTNSDITAAPQASAAFRRLVGEMVIRGVFQGNPPRAHINGRLVNAGEPVDRSLGIVFDSINAEKKTITFRDAAGTTITRRY